MDHADHRRAGRALGDGGPLSLAVASQLCRGGRRDRRAAAGVRPAAGLPRSSRSSMPRCWRSASAPKTARSPHRVQTTMPVRHERARPSRSRSSPRRHLVGFVLMCLGMFMAILDIQVVATSLPTIQHALAISPDAMSWIQTAYLIAEIIAIPLTGWLTRVLTLRWLFVVRDHAVHARLDRLRVQRRLCDAGRLSRAAGLCRRHADPGGVLRRVPAVSDPPASDRHHHGRHHGGAGADGRAGGRRLDHRDLFLALAVPDQRRPRHHRGVRHALAAAARQSLASPTSPRSTASRWR